MCKYVNNFPQNYTFETPSGETAVLLEFDVLGRDEVDSVARIPVLVAHERRGTVLMGRLRFTELLERALLFYLRNLLRISILTAYLMYTVSCVRSFMIVFFCSKRVETPIPPFNE